MGLRSEGAGEGREDEWITSLMAPVGVRGRRGRRGRGGRRTRRREEVLLFWRWSEVELNGSGRSSSSSLMISSKGTSEPRLLPSRQRGSRRRSCPPSFEYVFEPKVTVLFLLDLDPTFPRPYNDPRSLRPLPPNLSSLNSEDFLPRDDELDSHASQHPSSNDGRDDDEISGG
ncbi:hypothetical protein BDY24DRAFT_385267 [Mrakia frigida]|uniref:uncharacterized protein n=1 Tax=Mrakia frigida TaxID=29902 RepID=UPI003FCC1B1C